MTYSNTNHTTGHKTSEPVLLCYPIMMEKIRHQQQEKLGCSQWKQSRELIASRSTHAEKSKNTDRTRQVKSKGLGQPSLKTRRPEYNPYHLQGQNEWFLELPNFYIYDCIFMYMVCANTHTHIHTHKVVQPLRKCLVYIHVCGASEHIHRQTQIK